MTLFSFNLSNLSWPWRRRQKTVLIVEDDPRASYLITVAATAEGLKSVVATGAEEGLGILHNNGKRFVLVMIDVGLPLLGGWHLRKKIAERWPALHVCMMSASPQRLLQLNSGEVTMVLLKSDSYAKAFRDLLPLL